MIVEQKKFQRTTVTINHNDWNFKQTFVVDNCDEMAHWLTLNAIGGMNDLIPELQQK